MIVPIILGASAFLLLVAFILWADFRRFETVATERAARKAADAALEQRIAFLEGSLPIEARKTIQVPVPAESGTRATGAAGDRDSDGETRTWTPKRVASVKG